MYALLGLALAFLMSGSAIAGETVISACVARNNTLYNVQTDGAPPRECRTPEFRTRFLEIVDTTTYEKVRGSSSTNDGGDLLASFGDPAYLEVHVLAEAEWCYLYVWIDTAFEYVVNLNTGEKKPPQIGDFTLLQIQPGQAKADRGSISYMLPDGNVFMFSDTFLAWNVGDQFDRCSAAVTIQRDMSQQMWGK